MTFKFVILTALASAAHAGFINGGHAVGPTIGASYVSSTAVLRTPGSAYITDPYAFAVAPGRSYSSGLSTPLGIRSAYGSPYPYGVRNSAYPSVSGHISGYVTKNGYTGSPGLNYPSSSYSYSSPVLKNGYSAGFHGFNGGYNSYPTPLNYDHQSLAYASSPIARHGHGSFNGVGTGYVY